MEKAQQQARRVGRYELPDAPPPIETMVLARRDDGRVEVGFINAVTRRETTRVMDDMDAARKLAVFIAITRGVGGPNDTGAINAWLIERGFDPLPAGGESEHLRGVLDLSALPPDRRPAAAAAAKKND
jgi:hypothetical protein